MGLRLRSVGAEIQDCSVINGRGRAPLIVVPDTGTRPQTKQDRAGAGCHAQSPSSRKPECCSGGFGGKRGHRISGDDSRGELRRGLSVCGKWRRCWPYGRTRDLQETNRRQSNRK